MTRKSLTPVVLPADPATAMEAATKQYVDSKVAEAPLIGQLVMWLAAAAPTKWLLCQGQGLATATYPDLYAVLGFIYGGGGATFYLPDMRDRKPLGVSGTRPLGETTTTTATRVISQSNLPAHQHDIDHNHAVVTTTTTGSGHNHPYDVSSTAGTSNVTKMRGTATVAATTSGAYNPASGGQHDHTVDLPNFAGSSGSGLGSSTPLDIMDPHVAINFIIRALP